MRSARAAVEVRVIRVGFGAYERSSQSTPKLIHRNRFRRRMPGVWQRGCTLCFRGALPCHSMSWFSVERRLHQEHYRFRNDSGMPSGRAGTILTRRSHRPTDLLTGHRSHINLLRYFR